MTNQTDSLGLAGAEYPHLRKVGRYAFYAPCALGLGLLIGVGLMFAGINRDWATSAGNLCAFIAFLALRDIEKNAEKRAVRKVMALLGQAATKATGEKP